MLAPPFVLAYLIRINEIKFQHSMTISSLFTAKNIINHRHALAKKLTHHDFPKGAYLLIHSPHSKNSGGYFDENLINENVHEEYDDMTNDILTQDMGENEQETRHHKNRHSYRFRRTTASTFTIEHCCSKSNIDVCGRYLCH